ncbi:MAG TPA: DUF11 domain-containing protein [Verrucomicrobiae bacterium]|nr:DUF11 domain-containing protein [Verrucomicrobiae bacterium]
MPPKTASTVGIWAILWAACFGARPAISATPLVLRYVADPATRESRLTLRRQGARILIVDDFSNRIVATAPAAQVKRVSVRGVDGDHNDTLTVDFSDGLNLPGGIDFDGGAGGFDTLQIVGGNGLDVRHLAANRSDGSLQVGATEIRYRNLEPILDTVPSASFTFNLPSGTTGAILQDNGSGLAQILSTNSTFEVDTFQNKGALTINGGSGTDTLTLAANVWPDLTGVPVSVNGTAGNLTLIVDLTGATTPNLTVINNVGVLSGTWTFANRPTLTFSAVQSLNPTDVSVSNNGPASVVVGSNLTYTITVTNTGSNWAAGITVADTLPANTSFVSAAPSQGSCSGTSAVACSLGQIAPGASATVTLVARANSGASVSDTATVSTTTTDTNALNNSSSSTTTLSAPPTVPALSIAGLTVLTVLLAAFGTIFYRRAAASRIL